MAEELLLVGSVPCETAEDTFVHAGPKVGKYLAYLPDGEIGERKRWIEFIAYHCYHGHPDVETIRRPAPLNGVESREGTDFKNSWGFELKPGVKEIKFGEPGWRIGYARDAINSYFIFKTLKKEGVIPRHVRFQVSIPLPASSALLFFQKPGEGEIVMSGIGESLKAEVANIVAHVPNDQLAIQWDCAIENTRIERAINEGGDPEKVAEQLFAPLSGLNSVIPDEVAVGIHACYGTAEGWPTRQPKDVWGNVILLNAAAAAAGRKLQWGHLPTLGDLGDAQFAPMADLDMKGARVYVGMIHHLNDLDGMKKQMELIAKFVPEFGVAAPCGFGRGPEDMATKSADENRAAKSEFVDVVLDDHVAAAELLRQVLGK
jgi:hypothetical protein